MDGIDLSIAWERADGKTHDASGRLSALTQCMCHLVGRIGRPEEAPSGETVAPPLARLSIRCKAAAADAPPRIAGSSAEVAVACDPLPLFVASEIGVRSGAVAIIALAAQRLRDDAPREATLLERACEQARRMGYQNRWEWGRTVSEIGFSAFVAADFGTRGLSLDLKVTNPAGALVALRPIAVLAPSEHARLPLFLQELEWTSDTRIALRGADGFGFGATVDPKTAIPIPDREGIEALLR